MPALCHRDYVTSVYGGISMPQEHDHREAPLLYGRATKSAKCTKGCRDDGLVEQEQVARHSHHVRRTTAFWNGQRINIIDTTATSTSHIEVERSAALLTRGMRLLDDNQVVEAAARNVLASRMTVQVPRIVFATRWIRPRQTL